MNEEAPPQTPPQAPPPPVTTPTSIRIALFLYIVAIASPIIAYRSVRDSHDGFEIFGKLTISLGVSAVAALVAVICTLVGLAREPRSNWAMLAGFLAAAAVGVLILVLGNLH